MAARDRGAVRAERRRSGIGDTGFHRACWYQRDFDIPSTPVDEEGWPTPLTRLHFGAVDYEASVWVNDVPVAEHQGGIRRSLRTSPMRCASRVRSA